MATGFIYVLSNVSMPGLVKIGRTDRTLEQRIAQLNTTGVPTPFILEHSVATSNSVMAEREIHAALAARGVRNSGKREFFKMEVGKAKQVVNAIAGFYEVKVEPQQQKNTSSQETGAITKFSEASLRRRFEKLTRTNADNVSQTFNIIKYENECLSIAQDGHPDGFLELSKMYSTVHPLSDKWREYARAYINFSKKYLKNNIAFPYTDLAVSSRCLGAFAANYLAIAYRSNWINNSDYVFIANNLISMNDDFAGRFYEITRQEDFPEEVRIRTDVHKKKSL